MSNFNTNTYSDTYATTETSTTILEIKNIWVEIVNNDQQFHCVCQAEVNISAGKCLLFKHQHQQHPSLGPQCCVQK